MRLAPNLVSFNDAEMLPVAYPKRADKTPFYSSWLFGKTTAMFQTLEHQLHARKKRIVASCVCTSLGVAPAYMEPKLL